MSRDPNLDALFKGFETKLEEQLQQRLLGSGDSSARVSAIESLEQAWSEMEQRMNLYLKRQRNMCAPIGRLPDELVVEVLRHCLDRENSVYPHSFWCPFRIPSAYSLCARWRTLAVNAPCLWSKIILPLPLKMFKLLRDRSVPASLDVFVAYDLFERDDDLISRTGDSLRQIVPRVSRLHVRHPADNQMNDFLVSHIGQKEFSSLTFLEMNENEDEDDSREAIYVLNTPLLRKLVFHGRTSSLSCFPLANLTDMTLDAMSLSGLEILKLLSATPRLECFDIVYGHVVYSDDTIPLPNVSLPLLRRLAIIELLTDEADRLLHHLEVPPSAHLELWVCNDGHSATIEDFIGRHMATHYGLKIFVEPLIFTLMSKCKEDILFCTLLDSESAVDFLALSKHPTNLSRLELAIELPPIKVLIGALRSWNLLTHICVRVDEDDFERLLTALEETPDIVCPALAILDCTGTKFSTIRLGSFLRFRRDKSAPIQELRITGGFAEGGVEALLPLVAEFLEVDEM
ncbi:hypothetical protein SISSUDRAFT_1054344 [Sistotremastrum suecicum HHB10207 ss-3]|uniref:F-box domain-containing protein n=1 Tax=Sistotremastrum suecicum HHB10207 ss-3 TaxID=1314776 RepID=A0A165YL48_9AGAM|nr:hypothetical protein SISSUDRAFT_1054344 [Sistotremastrum suecicum HHB10207 ss-3]